MEKKLDIANLTVDEFTTVEPISIPHTDNVLNAGHIMEKNGIRHLPILENGVAIGIISKRDITAQDPGKDLAHLKVTEIMSEDPFTVRSTDLLKDVVFQMSSRKIGSALVNDENNKLYGIFTSIDALNSIIELM